MIPHGELAIRVVDESGRPIRSAAITVHTHSEPGEPAWLITKLRGRHGGSHRVRVPPGRYRIQVEPPRRQKGITYLGVTQDVLLDHSREPKTVELVLRSMRTYEVSGTVLLSESQHAERMMVLLRPVQHALPDVQHQSVRPARLGTPLDKQGRFVLHDVTAGVYEIELTWLDQALSSKDATSYPLREVTVLGDIEGLLLIVPSVIE